MRRRSVRRWNGWRKGALVTALLFLLIPSAVYPSCEGCHISLLSGRVRHAPLATGCSTCHQPVAGKDHPKEKGSMERGKPIPDICIGCHSPDIMKGAYVHPPIAEGKCGSCHLPHTADFPNLLKAEGAGLCRGCHRFTFSDPVLHKPVAEGNCIACHDPHAAGSRHLLKGFSSDLCYGCHDRLRFEGVSIHAPVEEGACHSCHNPHGSRYRKLLVRRYPLALYAAFSEEEYALCFDCHDPMLATDPLTAMSTRFRNGDENLHYRHLMLNERGRTCSACHDLHASSQEHLIAPAVRGFGSWEIPISYRGDETGGTCIAGCHKQKRYDRLRYVDNQ
ncbi:MAG: cytochrome c3 family protein [Desulfuromonadia bacterium]